MELHRYLLTIDQSSIGGKTHIRHPRTGQILPVPLHPERGAFVICDSKWPEVTIHTFILESQL